MLVEAYGAVASSNRSEFLDARVEEFNARGEDECDLVRLRVCERGGGEVAQEVAAGARHGEVDALVKGARKVRGEAGEAVAVEAEDDGRG